MTHPTFCFAYLPTCNKIVCVRWGDTGYYETSYTESYNLNENFAQYLNDEIGVSKKEAAFMVACSMNSKNSSERMEEMYENMFGKEKNDEN